MFESRVKLLSPTVVRPLYFSHAVCGIFLVDKNKRVHVVDGAGSGR